MECEAVLRPVGDPEGLAWALILRGLAAWRMSDRVGAAGSLRESLRGFQSLGHLWGLSACLFLAGQLAGARGEHERAVSLLGAAEALRESIGVALLPSATAWLDASVAQARTALGTATFDRAWQAGRSMTPDVAVADAEREIDLAEQPPRRTG